MTINPYVGFRDFLRWGKNQMILSIIVAAGEEVFGKSSYEYG